jgi:hypothetical protein
MAFNEHTVAMAMNKSKTEPTGAISEVQEIGNESKFCWNEFANTYIQHKLRNQFANIRKRLFPICSRIYFLRFSALKLRAR